MKQFTNLIIAALITVAFINPNTASAGNDERKFDNARAHIVDRLVTDAVEKHGKATGEQMSLRDVSIETDCDTCVAAAYPYDWQLCDYAEALISQCTVTVMDAWNPKTEYVNTDFSVRVSHSTDEGFCYGGGGGIWLDEDDFVVGKGQDKGSVAIPMFGIACMPVESVDTESDISQRSRYRYGNGWVYRSGTRGEHDAAEVVGMEQQLNVPYYAQNWIEHFTWSNRYGYTGNPNNNGVGKP